jgi:hypothetical protein
MKNMKPTKFLSAPNVIAELFNGSSIMSIRNTTSGNEVKFRVKKGKDQSDKFQYPAPHFVSVFTGTNESNYTHWTYMGTIIKSDLKTYKHGRKSKLNPDDKKCRIFRAVCNALTQNKISNQVEIFIS